MSEYKPVVNPVTGLEHTVMPKVKSVPVPKALLFVGNSFFFFNNGAHRCTRRLLGQAPVPPKYRNNMVCINGANLSWHDVESYFRPNAISSYTMDSENRMVFRDPKEQLWDSLILLDNSQGPIHPEMGKIFKEYAAKDAQICRNHNATPIFIETWCYADKPEMTAQLADATIAVANENDAIVLPVGLAFALAHKNRPGLNLLIGDRRHPKPEGTYLMACVIIETLFNIDVRTIKADLEVPSDLAEYLRETAHETVTRFFGR